MQEEKLKLVKLSKNQWHYKLIKFVFGNTLPDPSNLKNLCPYFWIMVAAMILLVPVSPFKLFIYLKKKATVLVDKFLEWDYQRWLKSISDEEAYDLYGHSGTDILKNSISSKKKYRSEKLWDWLKIKGYDPKDNKEMYQIFQNEFKGVIEKRNQEEDKKSQAYRDSQRRYFERKQRRKERDKKIKAFFSKFEIALKPFKAVSKVKVDFSNYNSVIRATKRFVGLVITLVVGFAVLMFCQILTVASIALYQVWDWAVVLKCLEVLGIILGVAGTIIAVGWPILALISYVKDKWEREKRIPIYLKPFAYLGIGVWTVGKYLLYYPLYFLIWVLIWRIIIYSVIWGFIKGIGRVVWNSMGIFKEYFGSSYTDLCLGVSWEEESKE